MSHTNHNGLLMDREMPKKTRPYSRYAKDAAALLGQLIRKARIDRKMTTEELADRAGLSRGLLRRIENGDLGCTLGAVFEAATIAGVPLFEADERTLTSALASNSAVMRLLPKAVHAPRVRPDDDF
ncbi:MULTISPECIES: helix-turn-helix transcriptional regulator [Bradyrhizobium]|uniref:helix-turn-helix transcriptional regulator n=2 Tax=Nitrobacteraceae TaxID=41294 RepID=UPI001FE167FE|nr:MULTISPECIES: helix-turn-helix transcriptional regulator [Bradyrhizobium]